MNIYVDASYCPNKQRAGIGVQHPQPKQLNVKAVGSLAGELIAIIHGCLKSRPGDVIVTDCLVAQFCLKRGKLIKNHEELVVNTLKLIKLKRVSIMWKPRECNRKADKLAYAALTAPPMSCRKCENNDWSFKGLI